MGRARDLRWMFGPQYAKPALTMLRVRLLMRALVVFAVLAWSGSAQAKGDDCTHTVEAGQTLGHIANRHGVSMRDLIDTNSALKKNPDMLRVGQELDVCAAKALAGKGSSGSSSKKKSKRARKCGSGGEIVEHKVKKGDTVSKIASRYAVTEKQILRRNASLAKAPHMLRVDQTVEVCVDGHRARASKLCGFITPTFEHEVVPGENLGQVAGRYGVRRGDLKRWNASVRKNPDLLRVGQRIRVCPEIAPRKRKSITYAVQSGDTLGEIAKRFSLTAGELERFQRGKLDNPSALRVNQELAVWVDGGIVDGFGSINRDKGVLRAGVQLPPGRNYHIKWAAGAWGTADTVRAIQTGISAYKRKMPGGPKVHIGDISKKGGGKFKPHVSHQHGRDVDIGYVLKGEHAKETRFRGASSKNLDVPRTWRLLKSLLDTDQVTHIFVDYKLQKLLYEHAKGRGASEELLDELFQYPRGRRRTHGVIRHWKGHVNHFHVRFRE